jgi:drug/metabolite transporter (DMT)-like permease
MNASCSSATRRKTIAQALRNRFAAHHRWSGAVCALFWIGLHVLCFSSSAVTVKAASVGVGILQIIFFRGLFTLGAVMLPRAGRRQVIDSFRSNVVGVLVLRAAAGFLGMYGVFYTITALPVPIAMTLTGITPVFVIFLESLVLKERIRREMYAFVVLAAGGIYLSTLQSPLDASAVDGFDVVIGLLAGLLVAVSFVSVRHAVKTVGTSAVVFWFGAGKVVGPLAFAGTTLFSASYSFKDLCFIALICALGVASDFAKTAAYRLSRAWVVSTLSLSAIPASGVLAWVFLGEEISNLQWAGMGVVLSALSIMMVRRR